MRFELTAGASFHLVGADQLGERVGAFFGQWQVTNLVNKQQRCTEIVAQFGAHLPAGYDGQVPANEKTPPRVSTAPR